jgi:NADH-quinone oxidoreductase subunit G
MSAQPQNPGTAPDLVNIEIDGRPLKAPKGSMIIEAADKAGIAIPRFCYHDKLPIAANCRMCLVDVEKAPKPMPACASPVMEGMKVYTQSKRALDAQRNVMEFLLINHPLDCPICDQGGECELQDLAMGYGRSVSRFSERKRVVPDEDLGPLVATDMTRCIQCTRCVRFIGEIAGTHELGGMFRGEHLEIGTYIGKSIESELSGNIVDVCPVGALTNKVFRFRARPWELVARESIGYHDALGSNLYLHLRRGEVLRAVPRDNDAINECWLSDRDRYSHQGLYANDRARQPLIRAADGQLREVGWDEAIAFVAAGLERSVSQHGGEQLGALVAPLSSSEEGALLARLVRGLGSESIDHRLRAVDLADGEGSSAFEMPLARIGRAGAILIVGGNPRLDQPMLGHRVRQAWKRGAAVYALNPIDFEFHFELQGRFIVEPWAMARTLATLARAAAEEGPAVPAELTEVVAHAEANAAARDAVTVLRKASGSVLLFGDLAVQHPTASLLRALARYVARATDSAFNEMPQGANAVGLARAGVLPGANGLHAAAMLLRPRKALIVHQAELLLDGADSVAAANAMRQCQFLVALGGYASEPTKQVAHAILPIGLPPEIDGTYVNADGVAQTSAAAAKLPGEARPGWRVLRALGAALRLDGFGFAAIEDLRAELAAAAPFERRTSRTLTRRESPGAGLVRVGTVPCYRVDAVVRRATALQASAVARPARVVLHPGDAIAIGLGHGARALVSDGTTEVALPVETSTVVPHGVAWVESAHSETAPLKGTGAQLAIRKA